jgi:hypothetical protein
VSPWQCAGPLVCIEFRKDNEPNAAPDDLLLQVNNSLGTHFVDATGDGVIDTSDTSLVGKKFFSNGLLIGDLNLNGIIDGQEQGIFISLADAKLIVTDSGLNEDGTPNEAMQEAASLIANWLNYLGNAADGVASTPEQIAAINESVALLNYNLDYQTTFAELSADPTLNPVPPPPDQSPVILFGDWDHDGITDFPLGTAGADGRESTLSITENDIAKVMADTSGSLVMQLTQHLFQS